MKKFIAVAALVAGFSIDAHAAATAPVQRFDIVNLIGSASAPTLQSPVTIKLFVAGSSAACYTATLPYNGAATIFAGTGLACNGPIDTITVVPGVSPGSNQTVYAALTGSLLTVPKPTNNTPPQFFNTQVEITPISTGSGNSAPVFSSSTGAITTPGTITATYQQSN